MTAEIVDLAEAALRTFGADLTRAQAESLLLIWKYRDSLTDAERREVLDRFPPGRGGPGR